MENNTDTPTPPEPDVSGSPSSTLLASARLLEGYEIALVVNSAYGNYYLRADEVIRYVSDPIAFWADHEGVERWRYATWREYMATNAQCTEMTKKGVQCLNSGESYPSVKSFVPGITDRCSVHLNSSANKEIEDA
jgi:hypothetical protein